MPKDKPKENQKAKRSRMAAPRAKRKAAAPAAQLRSADVETVCTAGSGPVVVLKFPAPAAAPPPTPVPAPRPNPKHVAIVAMGSSAASFLALAASQGGIHTIADEVWTINATASVLHHDRAFVMDDVKHTITREASEGFKVAQGILHWLPNHPGPVYTSTAYPEWPALVEFPIRDVLQSIGGHPYLNTSVAHAVAFAMHLGVQRLSLYGCDFTYPNLHASEAGRGCVEFLLGIATGRGMEISLPDTTTLMDAHVPDDRRLYGYHEPVHVEIVDGQVVVTKGAKQPTDASGTAASAVAS